MTSSNLIRLSLAIGAAVAVAAVGLSIFGGRGIGGPSMPVATATVSASPAPQPPALLNGSRGPGTFTAIPFGSMRVTFDVPEGWEGVSSAVVPTATGTEGPDGAALAFMRVGGLYADPCGGNAGEPDVEVGPTADDLATALAAQTAYEATEPTDIVIDGFAGKRMDLELPSDVDTCNDGQFWVWDHAPYAQGPDNRWHLWILDVEGTRLVILGQDFAGTPAEHQAAFQRMVDSIQIEP